MTEKHSLPLPAIIQGCKSGDEKCQESLYKGYYGYVISIALRYVGRRELAEEAVNDCFLKVFDHMDDYDDRKPFKAWVRQITVNICIDLLRKENRFAPISETQIAEHSFDETVSGALDYNSILKGLDCLPVLHRLVFNMYEIEGYSHSEIAGKLRVAESSSRTYLTRAKKKLQAYYQQLIKEKNVRI